MIAFTLTLIVGAIIGYWICRWEVNQDSDIVYIQHVRSLKFCEHEGKQYQLKRIPSSGILDEHIDGSNCCGIWRRDWGDPCRCRKCLKERGAIRSGSVTGHDLTTIQTKKEFVGMILCPTCGNKRCPHASDHSYACTDSNEPGQKGSVY